MCECIVCVCHVVCWVVCMFCCAYVVLYIIHTHIEHLLIPSAVSYTYQSPPFIRTHKITHTQKTSPTYTPNHLQVLQFYQLHVANKTTAAAKLVSTGTLRTLSQLFTAHALAHDMEALRCVYFVFFVCALCLC